MWVYLCVSYVITFKIGCSHGGKMIWLLGVINFHLYEQLSRDIMLQGRLPVSHNIYQLSHVSLCVCVCVGEGGCLPVLKCKLVTVNGSMRKEQR